MGGKKSETPDPLLPLLLVSPGPKPPPPSSLGQTKGKLSKFCPPPPLNQRKTSSDRKREIPPFFRARLPPILFCSVQQRFLSFFLSFFPLWTRNVPFLESFEEGGEISVAVYSVCALLLSAAIYLCLPPVFSEQASRLASPHYCSSFSLHYAISKGVSFFCQKNENFFITSSQCDATQTIQTKVFLHHVLWKHLLVAVAKLTKVGGKDMLNEHCY